MRVTRSAARVVACAAASVLLMGAAASAWAQPQTAAPVLPPAANAGPVIEVPPCPPASCAYKPLVAVAAMPPSYEIGRGILGQPKLYVPGQPVRNFVRWLTP